MYYSYMYVLYVYFVLYGQVNTDVLGCKQDESGNLGIINGWNPDVKAKHNEKDPNQHGMCLYSIEYKDKRIICR